MLNLSEIGADVGEEGGRGDPDNDKNEITLLIQQLDELLDAGERIPREVDAARSGAVDIIGNRLGSSCVREVRKLTGMYSPGLYPY